MGETGEKGERIAKAMARAGVASRRDAEKMILAGRVKVNGVAITSPALDVLPTDKVTLDGKPIDAPQETRLWLYYKPLGLVTSEKDEKGRQTVFDTLPEGMPRVMSIGRLDLNSEGLLLLTNDGGLKRRLELPSTGWLRKYRVRVNGQPNNATFDPLRRGIVIEGEEFQPMEITLDRQQGANAWLTVGIREGRNREVRRAMAEVGLIVNRLIRVSYGPFRLNEMQPGEVTEVKRRVLRDQLGYLLTGEEGAAPRREAGEGARGDRAGGERGRGGARPGRDAEAGGPPRRDRPAAERGAGPKRPARAEGEKPFRSRPRDEGGEDRAQRRGGAPRAGADRADRGAERRGGGFAGAGKPGERPGRERDGKGGPGRPVSREDGDKPAAKGGRPAWKDRAGKPNAGTDRPRGPRSDDERGAAGRGGAGKPARGPKGAPADRSERPGGRPGGRDAFPSGPRGPGADRAKRGEGKPRGPGSEGGKGRGDRPRGPGPDGAGGPERKPRGPGGGGGAGPGGRPRGPKPGGRGQG